MPAMGNIVINDGVPAAHTFAPVDATGGTAELADRSATLPAAWKIMRISVVKPQGKNGSHQVVVEIEDPTSATIDGVDTVVRTQKAKVFFYLSQQGLLAERKNLQAFVKNALGHATLTSVIENIEPIY